MPEYDFSKVDDARDFSPLPPGDYPCRLAAIDPNERTKAGDEMWKLRFVVKEGDYRGRLIFDRISFGEAALPRVKLLCSALGLDVAGKVDLEPELLIDREVLVTVENQSYFDRREGKEKKSNKVVFAGYSSIENSSSSDTEVPEDEDDVPF